MTSPTVFAARSASSSTPHRITSSATLQLPCATNGQSLRDGTYTPHRARSDELDLLLADGPDLEERLPPKDRRMVNVSGLGLSGRANSWTARSIWAIEARGRMVVLVLTNRPQGRTLSDGTYEIGIALFDSAERGRGLGTEVVRLFVKWLFEQGAEEVQGGTAAMPEQAFRLRARAAAGRSFHD